MNPFIHTGIVVQNDDPEKVGRVKVFVPGITNSVHENWTGDITNKEFAFTSDVDIKGIISTLREDLPWADRATTLFGGDTNRLDANGTSQPLSRPSDSMIEPKVMDAFDQTNYVPGDYSGSCAGMFSIPSVGSHVQIYFKGGDVKYPTYFAASHGIEEWQSIFKDNYPTDGENGGSSPYENKHVINTTKHTLEFIDSDEKEEIKLSHFSGSNIQMLNDYTSRFTVNDDCTLIGHDKYGTVKNNYKLDVGGETTVESKGKIIINCNGGKAVLVLNPDGTIEITGKTINVLADGGPLNLTSTTVINLTAPIINMNA